MSKYQEFRDSNPQPDLNHPLFNSPPSRWRLEKGYRPGMGVIWPLPYTLIQRFDRDSGYPLGAERIQERGRLEKEMTPIAKVLNI
jgi:hypothetical protein